MKLEHLTIENFRGIEHLELSFLDELGLPRDISIVVGPNTSCKTTILDAIALCLMPVIGESRLREGLRMAPRALVRSGAVSAKVSARVWFSNEEIQATKDIFSRAMNVYARLFPKGNHVNVTWTFPGPHGRPRTGHLGFEPRFGLLLFKGREVLARNLHVPNLGPRLFERLGDIVMIDQDRSEFSKRISYREREALRDLLEPRRNGVLEEDDGTPVVTDDVMESAGPRYVRVQDPRMILTNLALRAQVPQSPEATEKEDFARLKKLYEHVCHPHRIGDLINTGHGLDMEFWGDRGKYLYDGLSGGQEMILLMLLQFATKRIHRSIVLIDELELHLHPLWQDRLLVSLPKLGEDNQFIITTHSTHIRDTTDPNSHLRTGDLLAGVGARAGTQGSDSDG